jgi:hypothetical protein
MISSQEARWFFGRTLTFVTDPALLTSRLLEHAEAGGRAFWLSDRFLDAGDWSALIVPEAGLREHQEIRELVYYRERFHEAPAYRALVTQIAAGRPARRLVMTLDSAAAVDRYFQHYLALIESIETVGYRDRYSMGIYRLPGGGGVAAWLSGHHKRNIGVAIGPGGELFRFLGGRRRTAIAQALGLDRVAVEVRLVHAAWLHAESERRGLDPIAALRAWIAERGPAGPVAGRESPAGRAPSRLRPSSG